MKTQKFVQYSLFFVLVFSLVIAGVQPVVAQDNSGNIVTFTLLGQKEISLQGPLDVQSFSFNLPADWELQDGGQLHINYNTFFSDNANSVAGSNVVTVAGYIQVTLNNSPVGTIVLDTRGENSVDLPISLSAWTLTDPLNVTRSLQFYLRTAEQCHPTSNVNPNPQAGLSVIIRPSSYFLLPHSPAAIVTDLRRLPYPIYQDSFIPDKAVLVMPDNPSEAELQAAFTASAAFGRLSGGKLALGTTTVGKLDPARLADSDIIFVGKPAAFPQLSQATWAAPISGQGFSASQINADDGILQSSVSPQNPAKIWLLVSGQDDAGVVKAAQALASGQIRTNQTSNLSIISGTQTFPVSLSTVTDHTFADFGYSNQTAYGPGIRYFGYHFQIPPGQVVTQDAYIDLIFSHSSMFDFDQAGLSVSLNSDFIGSFRFSDRTAQVSSWRLNLPASSFKSGDNLILLEANLEPITHCIPNQELWFSARAESILHLPLEAAPDQVVSSILDQYPAPFIPTFDKTAFVVPNHDPASWGIASAIAYDLGWKTGGALIDPLAVFADKVPDTLRKERDLIVVGRPSTMPIMQELSSAMPAPFASGSDIAKEPPASFTFRVSNDTPVGYLQVFTSPWNPQLSVMTISGNGDDGLLWGANALITPSQRSQLTGNLAVLYNNQIIATQVNSAPVVVATPMPVGTQSVAATTSNKPAINIVAISAVAVVVLILLGLLVWWIGRRNER